MPVDLTHLGEGLVLIISGLGLAWIAWTLGWSVIRTKRQEAQRAKNINKAFNDMVDFPFRHLGKSTQKISDVKRHLKDMEDL